MDHNDKPTHIDAPDVETPPPQRKHYVLVVHGTFNAPKQGPGGEFLDLHQKWWAPGSATKTGLPFCEKLREALDRRQGGIPGDAVWGDISDPEVEEITQPFFWGAKNSDVSREEGAQKLAERIMLIRRKQPGALVHLIAHSHGGNVVLRAVEIILGELGEQGVQQIFGGVERPSCWRRWFCSGSKALAAARMAAISDGPKTGLAAEFLNRFGGELSEQSSPLDQDDFVRMHFPSLVNANPLGRMVFLGTPFLTKRETPNPEATIAALWFVTITMTSWGISLSITGWNGSTALRRLGNVMVAVGFCMAVFLDTFQGKLDPLKPHRPNPHAAGNIYHLTKQPWSPEMAVLVVHSGILDEANFALRSTAPLVRAYIVPEVAQNFNLQPWKSLPADIRRATTLRHLPVPTNCFGSYKRKAPIFNVEIMIFSVLIAILSFFLRVFLLPAVYLAKRFLISGLQRVLVHVVLGTGSAEKGVSGARVTVSETLRLEQLVEDAPGGSLSKSWLGGSLPKSSPGGSPAENMPGGSLLETVPGGSLRRNVPGGALAEGKSLVVHWNVQHLILDNDTAFGRPSQKEPRFDFLLEPEMLAPAGSTGIAGIGEPGFESDNSVVGTLLKAGCFDGLDEAEVRELMLIAQMLEERQKEITGQVEVRHSLYYSKLEILEAMAEFLQARVGDNLHAMLAGFDERVKKASRY